MAVGQTEGIGRRGMSGDFAIHNGPAGAGVFELFEHQHARPLADHEAVSLPVKWAAGAPRLVIACRHRRQEDEASDPERMDHAVDAAGQDRIGAAATDHLGRLADRLSTGGASGQA